MTKGSFRVPAPHRRRPGPLSQLGQARRRGPALSSAGVGRRRRARFRRLLSRPCRNPVTGRACFSSAPSLRARRERERGRRGEIYLAARSGPERVALRVQPSTPQTPPQVPVPPRSPLPPQLVRLPGPPLSAPAPPHRAGPAPPARVRRAGRRAERLLSPSGSLGRGRPPVPFARLGSVAAQSHPACRQEPAGLGGPAQPPAGRGGRIGYLLLEVCRYPRCPMMGRVGAAAGARAAPCGRTDTDGPGWDRAIG